LHFWHLVWFFKYQLLLSLARQVRHDSATVKTILRTLVLPLLWAAGTCLAAPPVFEGSMAQRTLACVACHGKEGRAASDGYYPRIAGKPAGYLYHQLLNFRDNRRHYGLMTQMVDPLSDAYLMEIAQYFAALDLPYPAPQLSSAPAEQLRRGQQLVSQGDAARQIPACAQCHGAALTGVAPNIPGLLGLPRDYLNAQLGAWRTGQRRAHAPDCMADVARKLAPDDVFAVTAWLAAQPLPANSHAVVSMPALSPGAKAIACGSAPAP
jgi:cytochrome c553